MDTRTCTSIWILFFFVCSPRASPIPKHSHAEAGSREINSDERRDLRKLFKNSREMDEAGLHEEEVGDQQIILREMKVVMNKDAEIVEIKTQEFKTILPVEHDRDSEEELGLFEDGDENIERHRAKRPHARQHSSVSTYSDEGNWIPKTEKRVDHTKSRTVSKSSLHQQPKKPSHKQSKDLPINIPPVGQSTDADSEEAADAKFAETTLAPAHNTTVKPPVVEKAVVVGPAILQINRVIDLPIPTPTRGDLPEMAPVEAAGVSKLNNKLNNNLLKMNGRGLSNYIIPIPNSEAVTTEVGTSNEATQATVSTNSDGASIPSSEQKVPDSNQETTESNALEKPLPSADVSEQTTEDGVDLSGSDFPAKKRFPGALVPPSLQVRSKILPLAQPYVILTGPVVFSNQGKRQLVVPTFLFNYQKPAPAYMSFGKLWGAGLGRNAVDDPRLTKEQFFTDPDSVMKKFEAEFNHHSKGSAMDVLNRMSIDAADVSRQFPLGVFENMEKNGPTDLKNPTNIFEFIKSLQRPHHTNSGILIKM